MRDSRSSRWIPSLVTPLLCLAAILLIPFGVAAGVDWDKFKAGDTVTITLRNGGKIQGTIVAIEADRVRLKHKHGTGWFGPDQVQEAVKDKSPKERFDEQGKLAKTADDWFRIGNAMETESEFELATRAFDEALKLDPDHAPTRAKRGEMLHEGKWVSEEEAMTAQGKKKHKGEWMTDEEIAEARRLEADALKAIKMKSRQELILEYEGRPWPDVNPIMTEHYNISCNSTEEVAREYAVQLEALYDKYSQVFKSFDPEAKFKALGKAKIWIHKNKQQFDDITSMVQAGGFYRTDVKDVHAYHGSFGTIGTTYEVLAHECTHQFEGYILKNFWNVPMWIIEGLAVFFGDGSEFKGGKVEIGLIPRERLEALQRTIETNSYPDLNTLLRTAQPFDGFFYAPAWGVVYRCLRGDKSKPKAHDGEELEMFASYLDRLARSTADVCDYDGEAKRFISELTGASKKHKTLEAWETDYKAWIMKLPLEQLMHRGKTPGSWKSDKLGFEVRMPAGWSVDKTRRFREEQIAFVGTGGKHRRISSGTTGNWARAELSEELVNRLISGFFNSVSHDAPGCFEPVLKDNLHGFPAVDTIFLAVPNVKSESSTGAKGAGEGQKGDTETFQYRVVVNASVDKVRVNVLEADPAEFAATNDKVFGKYLDDFKVED
ncbi:MAG: DUF1570 domain-containing protein [Planctomycetes bacterium]|nr:DUF1570 domain-containing protein [Planctomycetota bacterium]